MKTATVYRRGGHPSRSRSSRKLLDVLSSAVIAIALCVSYYPIEQVAIKIDILFGLLVLLLLLEVKHLKDVIANRYFISLIAIAFAFMTLCYFHRLSYPPLTDYADGKFRNLVFSLVFFLCIIPLPFFRRASGGLLAKALLFFSIVFCLAAFLPSATEQNARYSEIGLSPTMMGKIVLVPCVYFLAFSRGGRSKVLLILLSVLSVLASIRTGSRGPILALCCCYGTFLLLKNGVRGLGQYALYVPILVCLVAIALYLAPPQISERFTLDSLTIQANSGEGDRAFLWDLAWSGLQRSWHGYGLGNYSVTTFIAAPHNVILEALYELGFLIGTLYLMVILLPLLWVRLLIRDNSPSTDFFIILYIFMLMLSMISGEMTLTSALLYIAVGYMWGRVGELTRLNVAGRRAI